MEKGNVLITGFWGWDNFKWVCRELMKLGSNEPSYFSQKRIKMFVAFYIAQAGMVFFLIHKYTDLSMGEFLLWSSVEFTVAGFALTQTQKEKQLKLENEKQL